MKLAEALMLRADQKKKLEQLRQRLLRSAKVQEGETPPEEPAELMAALDGTLAEFTRLVKQINRTNATTRLPGGQTLTEALADRDALALKRNVLAGVIDAASVKQDRYSRSEVKFFSTINIAETQQTLDRLAQQYRELDAKIQETNWLVELEEN